MFMVEESGLLQSLVPTSEAPLLISRNALPRSARTVLREKRTIEIVPPVQIQRCHNDMTNLPVNLPETANGIYNPVITLYVLLGGSQFPLFRARAIDLLAHQADLSDGSNAVHLRDVE
jgi:hypothetical protein